MYRCCCRCLTAYIFLGPKIRVAMSFILVLWRYGAQYCLVFILLCSSLLSIGTHMMHIARWRRVLQLQVSVLSLLAVPVGIMLEDTTQGHQF